MSTKRDEPMEYNNEQGPMMNVDSLAEQLYNLPEAQAPASLIPSVLSRIRQASVSIQPTNQVDIDRLLAALRHPDWHMRATAVSRLGELDEYDPSEQLMAALHDEDATVRAAAVRALGKLGEHAPVNRLLETLHDSEWLVREAAALSLRDLGERTPTRTLRELANAEHEDKHVREAAKLASEQEHLYTLSSPIPATIKAPPLQNSRSLQERTSSSLIKLIEFVRRLPVWNINNNNWQEEDDNMALPDLDNIVNPGNTLQQPDAAKPKPHLVIRIGEVVLAALLIVGLTVSWLALVRMPHSSSPGRASHSGPTPPPTTDISSPLTGHDVNLTVNGGILYAGSADNAIYALRMSDGSMLWRYRTQEPVDQPPLVVNGIVYVSANMVMGQGAVYTATIYALRASDGTLLWHFTRNGYIYTPVVVNGVAYIGAWDNTVSALRASDGSLLWRFTTRGPVFDPLLVVNGIVYVSAYIDQGPGFVYALRANDGNLLWRFTTQGGLSQSTVVDVVAYVDSAEGITALRVSDGTPLWHFTLGSTGFSTPVVLDGIVYTIAVKVSLADASSGGGGYMARTISEEETIPFKSGVSTVYALRASDGTPLWHYTMNNGKSSWGTLFSIANGVIYTGANADTGKNSVYALQASDGTLLWHLTTDDAPTSGIVANGIIYIGSNSSAVFALRAHDGNLLWRYTRIGQVFDTPILSGNYLYVSAINGIIYALQVSSGSLLWYYQTDING